MNSSAACSAIGRQVVEPATVIDSVDAPELHDVRAVSYTHLGADRVDELDTAEHGVDLVRLQVADHVEARGTRLLDCLLYTSRCV